MVIELDTSAAKANLSRADMAAAPIPPNILPATEPSFPKCCTVCTTPCEALWGACSRPYRTNAWWNPACLEGGDWTLGQLPYNIKVAGEGLTMCLPTFVPSEKNIFGVFLDSLRIGTEEGFESRNVLCSDALSFTVVWRGKTQGYMESPIVQGCPFMTFTFSGLTPMLSSVHAISTPGDAGISGSRFLVEFNTGQRWIMYTSRDLTLKFNSNPGRVVATAPFTGVIRIVILPSEDCPLDAFDEHHNTYPIGGDVRLSEKENRSSVEFVFETMEMRGSGGDLLMMALPHHKTTLSNARLILEDSYSTIKGRMTGVLGSTWEMEDDLPSITWSPGRKMDDESRGAVRGALLAEEFMRNDEHGPYWFGKRIAAMARLALIADELEETQTAERIRSRMKADIKPWLEGTNANPLVYDELWGGLISREGCHDKLADFGNGMYNDHHFQYGYFIYAAAAIGKADPQWLEENQAPILDVVRDFANPNKDDGFFPMARHMDFFAGHSWASGLFCFQDDKNQESSSEAVNAYYGVWLLGLAMGNEQLAAFGRILTSIEIRGARTYWQMKSSASIYPPPFNVNRTVGILWGTKVDFGTWFGSNLEYIYCIQMLPFTPISEALFDPEWMREACEVLGGLLDQRNVEASWKGFIRLAMAVFDKERAWEEMSRMEGPHDKGNSVTNALHWVATRPPPPDK
ncbi:hypothetical protein BSKO_05897 [Bryopsis sp. KO-2023]|nr:hypothetical protein BSKO_05897 [Bryopsis sp. KO-2023]